MNERESAFSDANCFGKLPGNPGKEVYQSNIALHQGKKTVARLSETEQK